MQPTIPTLIASLLPLIASALSSWLNDDGLPPGRNALIALTAILVTAVACELLAGNFTGNWTASVLGTLGYVGVLMHGDFAVLYDYLLRKKSPIAPPPANPSRVSALGTSAFVPDGSSSPTVIPKRASRTEGEEMR